MTDVIVMEDFASPDELAAANGTWPAEDWPGWVRYDPATQCKRATDPRAFVPPGAAALLYRMASVQGHFWFPPGLVPDLGLWGAGLHEMPPGPGLATHVDAGKHGLLGLERVLSAVLYVHPRWDEDWGGELVVVGRRVRPAPGRMVVFDCRGVRHKVAAVTCPEGLTRRSLALFWYGGPAGDLPCRAQFEPEA